MKENQQNMQDDIERGEIIDNDQINQLEKTLGIVSEKMQDPKILEDYAKYNGSMKHQRQQALPIEDKEAIEIRVKF